jgi:hypothetical protein
VAVFHLRSKSNLAADKDFAIKGSRGYQLTQQHLDQE